MLQGCTWLAEGPEVGPRAQHTAGAWWDGKQTGPWQGSDTAMQALASPAARQARHSPPSGLRSVSSPRGRCTLRCVSAIQHSMECVGAIDQGMRGGRRAQVLLCPIAQIYKR